MSSSCSYPILHSGRNTVPGPLACIPNQKPELPAELPPTIAVSYPSGPEDDIDIGEEFSTTQEQQIESQPCTFGSPSGPKWIPCLSLRPPSSSVHGRKGSACIAWKEEDTEDDTGIFTFSHERPSTLLSGVGDQFVIGLGRRPSWLMWNDGNFNRSDGMETQRCSMA